MNKVSTAKLPDGSRSSFWRGISWSVGDKHANRICWLIDMYCFLFNLSPKRLWK